MDIETKIACTKCTQAQKVNPGGHGLHIELQDSQRYVLDPDPKLIKTEPILQDQIIKKSGNKKKLERKFRPARWLSG